MTDKKRPYRMKRRAELEAATRLRITESAVFLHGSIGPAQTSIAAIAKHAGVRRSTVYRHFPDEHALYSACSAHWRATNPPPDIAQWAKIADPDLRLKSALAEFCAYYRRTERMWQNVLRDEEVVPVLKPLLNGYRQYLAAARQVLGAGRNLPAPAQREVDAVISHALSFHTWRSLAIEQGLDDAAIVRLLCVWAKAASSLAAPRQLSTSAAK